MGIHHRFLPVPLDALRGWEVRGIIEIEPDIFFEDIESFSGPFGIRPGRYQRVLPGPEKREEMAEVAVFVRVCTGVERSG